MKAWFDSRRLRHYWRVADHIADINLSTIFLVQNKYLAANAIDIEQNQARLIVHFHLSFPGIWYMRRNIPPTLR